MEFQQVVRKRRMVRAFQDRPVPRPALDRILANALHAPSAGFSQGWAFVVLEGSDQTELFWRHTTDEAWRAQPNWPDLLTAPVLVLPLAHKQTYLDRYGERDKAAFGLQDERAWPVPFWTVDTAMASLLILLTAVDAGLGSFFFGIKRGREALFAELGIPDGYEELGAIAIGYPAPDRPSPSLTRGRRPVSEVVHRGRW